MSSKSTTVLVAAYSDLLTAEADWNDLENIAKEGLDVADAALVAKDPDGNPQILERQSHHGWGKGAVAGAVVGILFPPSLIAGLVIGGVAGGTVARLNRALGQRQSEGIGRGSDRGEIALVAVVDTVSIAIFEKALSKALQIQSEDTGLSDDDLKEADAS